MGYYVRVFCTASDVPPLRDLFLWAGSRGHTLCLATDATPADLDSPDWTEAAIQYQEGMQPILSDVSRNTGDPASLLREEIGEFREFLEDVERGPAKTKVLRHLARTRYIVANQYLGDITDEGVEASDVLLDYFVRHCGGMIQRDGEGFYEDGALVVACE